nr:ATPase, F1/V1/A1 complex, alpha/beta subunit, zinc knuckle CX2CX4HX4C [Tanacetum cinerariifolium]
MCHKITLASDTLIDFQIKFSISIGETVTHWFTLIVLSAMRRSDNENMRSWMNLILMSILTDLQVTPTKHGQMTKPYSSHRFIANFCNVENIKMEVKYKELMNPQYLVTLSFNLWTSIPSQHPMLELGVQVLRINQKPKVNSNFRTLVVDLVFDGVNIFIPRKVVKKVSTRFEHTLYGYFIGKRMAFLVVEYYARNYWAKHGLKGIMMNSKGFIFFKFNYRASLEAVSEGGPCFKKDGISLIAMFIDKPVMPDSYTSSMCNASWSKSSFARCLIEVNLEADLVDDVTIGIPSLSGDGFSKEPFVLSMDGGRLDVICRGVTSASKKGVTNVGNISQSSSMLKTTDDEEDVENAYDKSANLIQNIKAGENSSFTAVAG